MDSLPTVRSRLRMLLALSSAVFGCGDEVVGESGGTQRDASEVDRDSQQTTPGPDASADGSVPPAESVCSDLSVEACKQNTACRTIDGLEFDESRSCRASRAMAVGCMPAKQGCVAAIMYARDADGGTWEFTGGCVPTGWMAGSLPATPGTAVSSWPVCDTASSGTPAACTFGTELLSPGCATPEPTWKTGCYASCSAVGDDSSCAQGFTCQETWVNPCVPKSSGEATCDACGALTHLCLAAPAAR